MRQIRTFVLEEKLWEEVKELGMDMPEEKGRLFATVTDYNNAREAAADMKLTGIYYHDANGTRRHRKATHEEIQKVINKCNELYPRIVEICRDLHLDYPDLWIA